jgi:peroxiredoxin Q/BCP
VRELREFRVLHDRFRDAGIAVAGVSLDSLESHRRWAERLRIPYPLLSDEEREAGRAFGILRRVGIGAWSLELLRRSTFLVDDAGKIAAVWSRVPRRGHAAEVFEVARVLAADAAERARARGGR